MITPAQRAEIRRLYFGEHWKVGTIAVALGVHHETVRAALQHETGGLRRGVSRPSALDPFLPFIRDTLAQYPRLRATRLHEMLRQRGYPGSAVQVRRLVRRLRPQATTHVYRRVVTLAGEQAQVDWGTMRLLGLLDDYGPQALAAAIATALERDALGAGSIAHLLEIRRRQQGRTPPLPLALPNRPGVRDLDVRPHALESYDALTHTTDDPDE